MSTENEALVRRVYDELFGQSHLDVASELFATDFTLHNGMEPAPTGLPAVRDAVMSL